ncbi:LOW QUALITY PROTEIN: Predicted coiled coil protein, related [Eimeria mitis]|uniref:Predicted coiled coil protein, related n=1 Tax=Eimeria mitis TaxID=44415 RepID=U6KJ35_9EIME|nr:LOW QUALITY PROTEIN: Predicted coiled coil protein, related [Eimeria mitis]CDJ36287.1 Predicted coiled coil protein, related [Eimeria mitis]
MSKPKGAAYSSSSVRTPLDRTGWQRGNERSKDREDFWLDREAFSVFARQIDTPAVRSGFALMLLSPCQSPAVESNGRPHGGPGGSRGAPYPCSSSGQQWLRRYCELKGNVLFYAPHAEAAFEGAYLLEDFVFQNISPTRALVMGIVPELPLAEGEGERLRQGAVLVGSSRHDGVYGRYVRPLVMLLESSRIADAWKSTCESCSAAALQQHVRELQHVLQRERAAASREKEATALIAKQQEIALRETEGSKQTLLLEIERLQQRNQRLQATGEVTEKAAAEFVDQKMHEVSFLQNELATQLAGCKRLETEIVELREALGASQQKAQQLATENSRLNCRVSDLLEDLEDAKDNPSRFALVMNRLRAANQRAVIENKRLRQVQNTPRTRGKSRVLLLLPLLVLRLVALIRQVAEMGDAFDLLRKWLTCSERKVGLAAHNLIFRGLLHTRELWRDNPRYNIRYYEQGYKWSYQQEQEELEKIEELQRAIRVAEAAARSSYISHRAFLLGQQLKACTVQHGRVIYLTGPSCWANN